jgi:hypothetical protein
MPIPTASKWECMDEACRKNVHVSRALRILSTRVFLTRDGFGVGVPNWECLTAGAPSTQAAGMQARRAWVKKPPGPC